MSHLWSKVEIEEREQDYYKARWKLEGSPFTIDQRKDGGAWRAVADSRSQLYGSSARYFTNAWLDSTTLKDAQKEVEIVIEQSFFRAHSGLWNRGLLTSAQWDPEAQKYSEIENFLRPVKVGRGSKKWHLVARQQNASGEADGFQRFTLCGYECESEVKQQDDLAAALKDTGYSLDQDLARHELGNICSKCADANGLVVIKQEVVV
jgi:hypothetical protein